MTIYVKQSSHVAYSLDLHLFSFILYIVHLCTAVQFAHLWNRSEALTFIILILREHLPHRPKPIDS